jgi:hypothetical protein
MKALYILLACLVAAIVFVNLPIWRSEPEIKQSVARKYFH